MCHVLCVCLFQILHIHKVALGLFFFTTEIHSRGSCNIPSFGRQGTTPEATAILLGSEMYLAQSGSGKSWFTTARYSGRIFPYRVSLDCVLGCG